MSNEITTYLKSKGYSDELDPNGYSQFEAKERLIADFLKSRWIPVTEKLPARIKYCKFSEWVLCTDGKTTFIGNAVYLDLKNFTRWSLAFNLGPDPTIIAWQPLTPY